MVSRFGCLGLRVRVQAVGLRVREYLNALENGVSSRFVFGFVLLLLPGWVLKD